MYHSRKKIGDVLWLYNQELDRTRRLSREEEHTLAEQMQRTRKELCLAAYQENPKAFSIYFRDLQVGEKDPTRKSIKKKYAALEKRLQGKTLQYAAEKAYAFLENIDGWDYLRSIISGGQWNRQEIVQRYQEWKSVYDFFVESNLLLARKIAGSFGGNALSLEDKIQHANIGLMRAVDKFDPKKGCKFSTYAQRWIMRSIQRAIEHSGTIRLPVPVHEQQRKLEKKRRNALQKYGRPLEEEEIAREMRCTTKKLQKLRDAGAVWKVTSLDHALSLDCAHLDTEPQKYDSCPTLENTLTQQTFPQPDTVTLENDRREKFSQSLENAHKDGQLTSWEYEILKVRYGFSDGERYTFKEVAEKFGKSKLSIQQTEKKALKKLREMGFADGFKQVVY